MKVCIVGGGPSALFLAILLKSRKTAEDIQVFEQNPKDATYGFGVGLADSAIDKLSEADPETMVALQEKMHFIDSQVIENCAGEFKMEYTGHTGAITRLDILNVLEKRCQDLGIEIQHDVRIDDLSRFDEFDLVVGADGANSVVRNAHVEDFGTQRLQRTNYFVWWGCENSRSESGLRFRRVQDSGVMVHYYSYTPEMWTVVGELDEKSWFDLGMESKTNAERKQLFEEIFDDVFEERPMIENKSNWVQFEAITNEHWSVGNRVLMGDAVFRAHYSLGSGTRLAMEDALGLADALRDFPDDLQAALAAYEERGKPRKQGLMDATRLSLDWYEKVHENLDVPILEFIQDFMGRTKRMPMDRLREFAPNFVAAIEAGSR